MSSVEIVTDAKPTMTITRALAELKLLDKRINNKLIGNSSAFVSSITGQKPPIGYAKVEDVESQIKENYQSVLDLIDRRKNIKSAIVASNARTYVTIAGKTMTVADAIERKLSIQYEKDLLGVLRSQYNSTMTSIERKNMDMEQKLDKHIETMLGADAKKNKQDDVESLSNSFKAMHETKIVDPLGLRLRIEALTKEIDEFESEVDFVLSESNTVTHIEVL